MYVIGISVVRDEVDVIEASVRHALRVLCDRVLVLDNGSADGTWEVLTRLARTLPLKAIRDDGPFDQSSMMTGLLHEASTAQVAWVVPFDADEFWWSPGSSPRAALDAVPEHVGVLTCPVKNFVARRSERELSPTSLLSMGYRALGAWADRTDVIDGQAGFVELRYPPKVLLRPCLSATIGPGQHEVRGHGREGRSGEWLTCLHAPLRSFAHLQRRALLAERHLDSARSGGPTGSWQFQMWARLASEDKLDKEWERNSQIGGRLGRWSEPRLVRDRTLVKLVRRSLRHRGY